MMDTGINDKIMDAVVNIALVMALLGLLVLTGSWLMPPSVVDIDGSKFINRGIVFEHIPDCICEEEKEK